MKASQVVTVSLRQILCNTMNYLYMFMQLLSSFFEFCAISYICMQNPKIISIKYKQRPIKIKIKVRFGLVWSGNYLQVMILFTNAIVKWSTCSDKDY